MNSLYGVTLRGGYSLGLVAQGWLADQLGLRLVPTLAAGLLFTMALALHARRAFAAITSLFQSSRMSSYSWRFLTSESWSLFIAGVRKRP